MSVSLANVRPAATTSAFSSAKFSMMPLWTTATRPAIWGWALRSAGTPCVAQRVWPMPVVPGSGSAANSASRLRILPSARRLCSAPSTSVATPAES